MVNRRCSVNSFKTVGSSGSGRTELSNVRDVYVDDRKHGMDYHIEAEGGGSYWCKLHSNGDASYHGPWNGTYHGYDEIEVGDIPDAVVDLLLLEEPHVFGGET